MAGNPRSAGRVLVFCALGLVLALVGATAAYRVLGGSGDASAAEPPTGERTQVDSGDDQVDHDRSGSDPIALSPPPASLEPGMSGPDVSALQRRLADLRYQVRRVDGQYDDETRHAVIAFEKVQGLPRDGVADAVVQEALDDPVVPTARETHPGLALEVNLALQVTYLVTDGEITAIYDSCTGAAGTPTPVGDFRVQYKIDGMRYADLGPLYRPMYFTFTGVAFHGNEPVRTTPDSHGCVRMTDPTVDELFGKIAEGTPVAVYDA